MTRTSDIWQALRAARNAFWGALQENTADRAGTAEPRAAPAPSLRAMLPDFPTLAPAHLADARLYSDREAMFRSFMLLQGGVIGEVGVGVGWFSKFLIDRFEPSTFVAFDLFDLHTIPMLWGQETSVLFEGKTHYDFYRDRFIGEPVNLVMEQGVSYEKLANYPDSSFDLLYIDASHVYEDVRKDADTAKRKVKSTGVLVFNDYIIYDHLNGGPYGVVPAVNELIVEDDWKVIGFALQQQMFCDIALRRFGSKA